MNNKTSLFLFGIIILCLDIKAQTVHFLYDDNGNRTNRWLRSDKVEKKDSIPLLPIVIDTSELILQSNIYPNPTVGFLNIEIHDEESDNLYLLIYDQNGQELEKKNISSTEVIDLRQYGTGLYFILIMSDTKKSLYKIIKQ